MKSLPSTLWKPPPTQIKPKMRTGYRKSQYAINASKGEILLPPYQEMGYLKVMKLIRQAQTNDQDAYQKIWVNNTRLCYSVANTIRVRRDLVSDLIQESQEAFPKAIQNFETERLLEFSTYAYAAIKSQMLRALSRIRFSTRVPSQLYKPLIRYLVHLKNAPSRSHWFDARESMIYDGLYNRIRNLHAIANPTTIRVAKHATCVRSCPVKATTRRDEIRQLQKALLNLDDRSRFILIHRYGLWNRPEMTLKQLGDILGLTRERVRQLQLIAEQQLRTMLVETDLNQTRDSESRSLS